MPYLLSGVQLSVVRTAAAGFADQQTMAAARDLPMTELINSLETFSDAGAVARPKLTVAEVHARHGEFIWKTLYRMGVRAPHLEDVYQEVFLVVHRRLDSYAGHCAITTWLFEVCFRVAAGYRRRAHFRREQLVPDAASVSYVAAPTATPEREVEKRQAADRLHDILNTLNLEQRVVFTMFELEGLTCDQIGESIGVPVGTVYSRLHRARKAFLRALSRQRARDARRES
jgi:RNA polymerase sigma-70 factor (ECF subfamily)